ncbi:MAG: hypothetical protein NZN28_04540 [Meiothermus sp.]|nr:hypothetical protein [Meiothermus sp.]
MLQGTTGGIEPGVRRQASHLITFRVSEPREVQALARPEGGLPPEYGFKDLERDFAGVVKRAQQGRVFVRLD